VHSRRRQRWLRGASFRCAQPPPEPTSLDAPSCHKTPVTMTQTMFSILRRMSSLCAPRRCGSPLKELGNRKVDLPSSAPPAMLKIYSIIKALVQTVQAPCFCKSETAIPCPARPIDRPSPRLEWVLWSAAGGTSGAMEKSLQAFEIAQNRDADCASPAEPAGESQSRGS
jgi:hypothetical protein